MLPTTPEAHRLHNAGWIAGALVIIGILAIGAALWLHYHP